ncbi:MAG: vanadium-dependent haloperoxidase [Saprospiraceae bacterium]|nr:vanadium-dependent haloperoxidase [Saprospiraceae bacterium]
MKNFIYILPLCIILSFTINSCTEDEVKIDRSTSSYSDQVATKWFELQRGLIRTCPGFSPPVASRALGYSGVCLYQSVNPGMLNYHSLEGQLNGLNTLATKVEAGKDYEWQISANASLAEITRLLYANAPDSMKQLIEQLERTNLGIYEVGESQDVIDRSVAFGKAIANEIFQWSKTDGGHEGYLHNFPSNYNVPVGPGLWVPTSSQKIPLQPYWGDNRSFVTNDVSASQPILNIKFSTDKSSTFFKQAEEVYNTVKNASDEQKLIARYWSDDAGLLGGTPPGHSISILSQILQKERVNLSVAAEMYAKAGMALADAFISCWKCKYTFNLLRPVSYIHQNIDPNWQPLLATPPFPEFTSGHSSQSGAFSAIMSNKFGNTYAFIDRTHVSRTDINGTARSFSSFDQMALEAANSRLYGGIHFREANETGVSQGKLVGEAVIRLQWSK